MIDRSTLLGSAPGARQAVVRRPFYVHGTRRNSVDAAVMCDSRTTGWESVRESVERLVSASEGCEGYSGADFAVVVREAVVVAL
ncbi:hypothetical protein JVU11DRAFT_10584 [Chiua virens]|nr:hypothetical protein JVU11DRAFT_10584 [Chiua virens]